MKSTKMVELADLFEQVRMKPTTVALAACIVCGTSWSQQIDSNYGTKARDTTGSARLYDMPLASELSSDAANCVADQSAAVAYAAAQRQSGITGAIVVQQCRVETTVNSAAPSQQLRSVFLGNVWTVMPDGQVYSRSRGVGTYEKSSVAPTPAFGPAPIPAPAPVSTAVSGSAWFNPNSGYTDRKSVV